MTDRLSHHVWLLQGARTGDNAQLAMLAQMLGGQIDGKALRFNALRLLPGWMLGASTASLTGDARALISPPWPDLVIAAGKRSAPVARYIKQASGGRAKLVQIGRPRMRLDAFDLVISTPQYGLPPEPNVIEMPLPFAAPKPVAVAELEHWRRAWQDLPRPLISVAIGAAHFPQRFGAQEVEAFAARLQGLVGQLGGSLLVIGSPRTAAASVAMLRQRLAQPVRIYGWGEGPNPYQAALTLADRFVVTADSMSMLSEAINTGKPVSIFRLPVSPWYPRWSARGGISARLARSGILTPPRNMPAVIDRLIGDGFASELGAEGSGGRVMPPPDYEAVAARVRALIG